MADLTVQHALDLLAGTAGRCKRRGDPGDLEKPPEILPTTVLDARTEYWQARKRAWIALGIQSELGRDGVAFKGQSSLNGLLLQRRGLVAVVQRNKVKGELQLRKRAKSELGRGIRPVAPALEGVGQ